ncbi:MAG: cytochrome c, partial [Planctomycetaceae bacterium]|nr:cytochrome c [Planctomycetaceae bacterium]
DCRGCHAHYQPGLDFAGTAASQPEYAIADLTNSLRYVEWKRDIKPLLNQHCGECHTGSDAAGSFVIDDNLRADARVVPFRSTQSKLMDAVLGHIEGMDRMPKGRDPLSAADIRTLATWIDLGAPVDKGAYWKGLPAEGNAGSAAQHQAAQLRPAN